ncbi:hypothetical protein QRX50_47995 [Amycolatopsis carbonis]|uniref:Uncharacterized protein n=1 Tax=Amycolatopsis carbonis TaxID=715471 RepID=A0A9Y2IIJ6_9PSEU|nr:hypothetical protein [Amycolatopsis sp. 2-15]WIX78988.1 hypothetical protein QRX50_47995 [Amycolatopsis sp. 2-15]
MSEWTSRSTESVSRWPTPDLLAEVFGVRAHVVTHPVTGRARLLFDRLESEEDSQA